MALTTREVLVPTATEIALDPSPLFGRRFMSITNNGPNAISVGATGVTTGRGITIAAGATYTMETQQNPGTPGWAPTGLFARALTALQVTGAATIVTEWT
jgi:hypothetical protein